MAKSKVETLRNGPDQGSTGWGIRQVHQIMKGYITERTLKLYKTFYINSQICERMH